MVLPAAVIRVNAGVVPGLDVETLLARLPAEARARTEWAARPIEAALARLRSEPLTLALLDEAADQIWTPLLSIGHVFAETMSKNPDEWRAFMIDDLRCQEVRLRAFVDAPDASDTVQWVIGLLRSLYDAVLASLPAVDLTPPDDESIARIRAHADFKSFARGFVALMAATRAAKEGGAPTRAHELLEISFLEFVHVRNALRRVGVWLSPFPNETVDERRARLLHYAEQLRNALTPHDWTILDEARLRDLR